LISLSSLVIITYTDVLTVKNIPYKFKRHSQSIRAYPGCMRWRLRLPVFMMRIISCEY